MTKEELREIKLAAFAAIDAAKERNIEIGKSILRNPELGFKEQYAKKKVLESFSLLEIHDIRESGLTGLKGWLKKDDGPCVAVIGELDAVVSPEHPLADPQTGAAHACGHNAQISTMLGCAAGLKAVTQYLSGSICLIAAPAEEYVEVGWRSALREQRIISYLGGKQELIHQGMFDDVDMAIMIHSETDAPYPRTVVGGAASGFIGKEIHFIGREAHAGGAPWEGINALNAANLALNAINCARETFKDEDRVRVHPIITHGGDIVNTVPAHVTMESYVRGANIAAIKDANAKVNRAIKGSAFAVGAEALINDIPGYLPLHQNPQLADCYAENAEEFFDALKVEKGLPFCGSTDMGDLSYLLPVIQPTVSGFAGAAHSRDFTIIDEEMAFLLPAKLMAATVIDLLADGAARAKKIQKSQPKHSKEEYEALWRQILDT